MAKVKIDKDLYKRAEVAALELGYSSVLELVTHLLERALSEHGQQEEEDRKAVEERLRGLGYLE